MSRSRKHNPYLKWSESDKKDKIDAHRKFRRISKHNLEKAPIYMKEVSDVWNFASDGGARWLYEIQSKDPEELDRVKRYMRK